MKAILVIDKPKDCFTCELGGSKVCIGGCPLKPIPNEACEMLVQGLDAMEKMKSVEVRVVRRTE